MDLESRGASNEQEHELSAALLSLVGEDEVGPDAREASLPSDAYVLQDFPDGASARQILRLSVEELIERPAAYGPVLTGEGDGEGRQKELSPLSEGFVAVELDVVRYDSFHVVLRGGGSRGDERENENENETHHVAPPEMADPFAWWIAYLRISPKSLFVI
jgi:hypothetical protein